MLLKVESLKACYGGIRALKGVDLEIREGEIISLIGSNGAGKTTTLSAILGLVRAEPGTKIVYDGEDITNFGSDEIVRRGICLVPEGREVFPGLSVEANLRLGAYICRDKKTIEESYGMVYQLFPRLAERKRQMAGTLSGGEQQMLAIGRALMSRPRLLLLDEPSLGLAPNLVQLIFKLIADIHNQGVTILLVEQNAAMALKIANRAYIMETGKIRMCGEAKALRNDDNVRKAYLGH